MTANASTIRPLVTVVTDLDGTLLDHVTYGFEPARPALAELAAAGAELVLASSKTRGEMEPLARRIGGVTAMICENGGELLLPLAGGGYRALALGTPRGSLVEALAAMTRETGIAVRGFWDLPVAEIARLTGLDVAAAALAMERSFDEPFVVMDERAGDVATLTAAAARRGLKVTRGGRFLHLLGDVDKGRSLSRLLVELGGDRDRRVTIGLGDAANDLPLLRAVDRPILVPRPGGGFDPELAAALPAAWRAPAPGPLGWNAAVHAALSDVAAAGARRGGGAVGES